jgi:hypothetical protein
VPWLLFHLDPQDVRPADRDGPVDVDAIPDGARIFEVSMKIEGLDPLFDSCRQPPLQR